MQASLWIRSAVLLSAALLAGGCNGPTQSAAAPAAQESDKTFQDFGTYEVHYNALRTDTLSAEIARSYGIQRSTNRVMLNVTILRKEADHAPRKPVDGVVQVDAYNLNGQLKNLEIRRIAEGEAIYYIGEVSISGTEILVFDITVTPQGEATPLRMKFKREFYAG
jgi:hypothetical protein